MRSGPGTRCMARGSAAGKRICSHSSTTIPARSSGTAGASPRTPSALPPRCARRWRRAGSPTDLRRQRLGVRRRLAAARLRETRDPADPLHARAARRAAGRSNAFSAPCASSSSSRSPGTPRATPAGTDHRPGRAQRAVHRVGRDRLPPPDRTPRPQPRRSPAGGRRPVPDPEHRRAGRGVPLGGTPHRHQDRAGLVAGQPLPGRPAAGRSPVELVFDPFDLTRIQVRLRGSGRAPRSRTGSAATPTPRPDPRPHPSRRHRPGSTTPPASPRSTTAELGAPAGSTTPRSPAAPRRQPPPSSSTSTSSPDSSTCSPTARPPTAGWRRDRPAARLLRVHPHPVRPRPRPRDAAPPRLPRRSRRPDLLVHQRTPIGVITGEVGAGKTVAVRTVIAGLDPSRHTSSTCPTR